MMGEDHPDLERDYFGGGAWCYYPESMLIRIPLKPEEFQKVSFPDLLAAPADHTSGQLFESTSAESKLVFARFKHELDHLVRLMSTSVGLFTHQLDSQLPDQLRWIASQTPPDRRFDTQPLLSDQDLTDQELFSTKTERHAAVRLWHRTDSLRKSLYDPVTTDTQFVSALTLLNWFREGEETFDVEAAWPPTPQFTVSSGLGTITGRNIIEFFAVLKEIDFAGMMGDLSSPWQSLLQDRDYNAVMLLWNGAFPGGALWDVDRQAGRLERDLALFVRRAYPLELYACLDLALWPPLVPLGVHSRGGKLSWRDIHPGHRFVTLCEWLQRSKRPLTRIGGEERNEVFRSFQADACETLGWPTVEELLEFWQADNRRKLRGERRETNRLMGISLERPEHSRLHMVDRLLQFRREAPCDCVLGNFSEIKLKVHQLGLITPDHDNLLVIGESEGGAWDFGPRLLRSLIMCGRFLLRGRKYGGDHPAYYRPDAVEEALKVYRQLLSADGAFDRWARSVLDG